MYVDIKSWELLKKYIDDLYWDNDRLSSSGKYTLNHIDSMLNKIEEKYNNKIYVITSDYVYDDNGGSTIIGITFSKKEAKKLFDETIKQLKLDVDFDNLYVQNGDDVELGSYEGWIYFKSDNSFSLYENGEYNSNHYDVSLNELDLLQERVEKKDKELG